MKHKPATDTAKLSTEQRNPATQNLDTRSALEIARLINAEDAKVAGAVKKALPQIARAIDAIADAFAQGGRLIYVGTGNQRSHRRAGCGRMSAHIQHQSQNCAVRNRRWGESVGQSGRSQRRFPPAGQADIAQRKPTKRDVVVGLAASGRTPYTVAAVEYARSRGAVTVALTCNRGTPLEKAADIPIVVEVGPEVVAGSTRMKAGTAQKMVLNLLSTGAMARAGYVYGDLMVNARLKNSKLVERGIRIIQQATVLDRNGSIKALRRAAGSVPVAIVMARKKVGKDEARRLLKQAKAHVRQALDEE